ncbi:hypothetical protein [Nannocystis exedens]|uniref:hypothetical protein n=1 Tax=Nannocystis exedens TaxID=54 RepID=UPI000BBA08D8|nr:hypothetical protein [Nannocystis exedens]PCC71807.1 hypothetical protein NAEX_04886 [Nannocystis exedens]
MTTHDEFAPTKAVFYFRTLDRWPGGNADMITIKAVLRLSPGAAPELEAQFYRCFDGRHMWYPPRRVAVDSGEALAEFLAVARSLAARGSQALAIHRFDAAEDEWDPDWADSEVLLYATDDGPETPEEASLRLVRRASKSESSAPDPELERAFELAHRLTGVGRVSQFGNTEDALAAAYWGPDGAPEQDFDYTVEATPTYLPPETDAVFLELQAAHAQAKAQAEGSRPKTMLVYRLDEVPEFLTRELPPDASVRQCLFFAAREDHRFLDALIAAVPEREHDDTDAAMDIADRVTRIASQSEDFAKALRPDKVPAGGAIIGGTYGNGFHGGDAEAVERWLEAHGVERVSLRTFLDKLILLRLVDEEGAPLEQVDKVPGGPPARTENSLGDGLYVFERDRRHVRFELAQVLEADEEDDEDEPWLELRSEDLPPGVLHTVTVPAPAARKAAETKKAEKQAPVKMAAGKKTTPKAAAGKTAAKAAAGKKASKAAAGKTAAKAAAGKKAAKAAAGKKAAKAAAGKKASKAAAGKKASKAAGKKTAKAAAGKKTTSKAAASKKTAAKKTASKPGAAKKKSAKKTSSKQARSKKTK